MNIITIIHDGKTENFIVSDDTKNLILRLCKEEQEKNEKFFKPLNDIKYEH